MKLVPTLALLLFAPAASAQFSVIASDDFDSYAPGNLGGLNGGTGWFNSWFSGGGMSDAVVSAPGLGGTINTATTNVNNAGSFRGPANMPFPQLVDGGEFGADGGTIWLRFRSQRIAGGDDQYGGLSLQTQFVGEKLFIGSPFQTFEWGVSVPGGATTTVMGSNVDADTLIVVRMDHQPGDERFRMWLNPTDNHPIVAADVDVTIPDLRWNEIRLQSGEPITTHGYHFDEIVFDTPTPDTGDLCNGDGGNQMGCTDCPCGNNSPMGTIGGCLNSGGTSSRLLGSGTDSIGAADLRFEASGVAPSNSCVLTSGSALAPAQMTNPCFGMDSGIQSVSLDGLRCVVQGVLRHGVRPSDAQGDVGVTTNGWGAPNGFFNFGAFMVGETRYFQIIHRDDSGQVCMTGQNTSQAICVTFTM